MKVLADVLTAQVTGTLVFKPELKVMNLRLNCKYPKALHSGLLEAFQNASSLFQRTSFKAMAKWYAEVAPV